VLKLTTTESAEVGLIGDWPVTLTEIGGAEVFITATLRLASCNCGGCT
jgi:hypothetical protein